MASENTKEHQTRKASDGVANSVCRQRSVESRSTQIKEGKSGPQMPAFDEARRGGFYMSRASDKTSTL